MTFGPTRMWYGWTGDPGDTARETLRTIHAAPDGLYRPPEMLRRYLHGQAKTPATCSILIRREALSLTGLFEERFTGLYEHQAFFVKAYLKLSCYVTSEALDLYRQHADSHVAGAKRTGHYSHHRPTAALADLHLWCARYFVRERVADLTLWRALLPQLASTWLHRLSPLRRA